MRTFQKRAQTLVKATVQLQSYIGTRVSIIGDFNTTLALIDRSFKQKLNRNAGETGVTSQMELAHVSKAFHPHTKKKNIFFSALHETFSKIDHILKTLRKSQQIQEN